MCLPLTNMVWWQKQRKSHSTVARAFYGPRNSLPYSSVRREGSLRVRMPSKQWNGACNLYNIKYLQLGRSSQVLYDRGFKVQLWMLNTIPRLVSRLVGAYYGQSHDIHVSLWDRTHILDFEIQSEVLRLVIELTEQSDLIEWPNANNADVTERIDP
jgi:hypothetical protein